MANNLEAYLDAYVTAAGIDADKKLPLFRSALARSGRLTDRPLRQSDVYRMLRRRALAAGTDTGSAAKRSGPPASRRT
jgi:integrase/recombinase XerD